MSTWLHYLRSWLVGYWLLVTVAGWGQCLPAPGCRPGSAPPNTLGLGFGIQRVRLASLDTTTNGATDGYQDYSCRRAARLDRGTTYVLQVSTGPQADERVRAWLDFNQDGVFDPATEQVLSSVGRQHAGSFTVPAGLPPGAALRLRVAADYVTAPVPGPCTTPQYSQTEDYRVLLTAASPPPPVAQLGAADSVSCSGTVQLRDRSRNAPTSWHWDFGDGTTSPQQHPVHHYAAPGTYAVRLRACNASGCDSLTRAAFVAVRGDGPLPAACQPATAAYCCGFGLLRVRLAGLDHQPGGGAAGYQDASCAYRATLRADWPDTLRLTTGGVAAHDVRVYLDLNNDGQLDPAAELLYQGLGVTSPVIPLRLSSQTAGLVYNQALRLRVWTDYAGSAGAGPCAAPQLGQVADYSLTVLPNSLAPRAAFQLVYAQTCGAVKMNFVNASVGSASYRWDFGDGTSSTAAVPPAHTYAAPGVYTIKLVARGPGQADSATRQTAVAPCQAYCASGGWGGNEDSPLYFTRVQVADMVNASYRGPRVGYRDFTSYVATLRQGQPAALRLESLPFSSGGSGPWIISTGWIDYNQDGQFGPSEQLGTFTGFSPQLGSFRVPHGARVGGTRLRLVCYLVSGGSGIFYNNGCLPASYLCATEDYSVMILPEQAAPSSGFTADLLPSCSGRVQFRDTTWAAPTSWQWQFGDGSSSALASPQHRYAAPGTYAVTLQTSNAFGTSTVTRPAYVTVTDTARGPRPARVALSTGLLCCTYGIAQAQLAGLTYQGGVDQPGYRDETCQQPPLLLRAGQSYPITVMRTGRVAYHHVYLWLDANDDGFFAASERIYASTEPSTIVPKVGSFTIPASAVPGRPLRLRLFWHGLRQDDFVTQWPLPDPQYRDEDYDQVRDFTVRVSAAPLASVRARSAATWSLYPNPMASGTSITLTGLTQPQVVRVCNVLGQQVFQSALRPAADGTASLPLPELPAGLYYVVPGAVAQPLPFLIE